MLVKQGWNSAVWIYKFALVGIEAGNVDRLDSCSQRRHLERHAGLESLFLGPLNIVSIEHHYRIFTARYFLCSKQMLQGQVPIFELQPRQLLGLELCQLALTINRVSFQMNNTSWSRKSRFLLC